MNNDPYKYKFVTVAGKLVGQHRLVMEGHLGRKLTSDEIIHHINGMPGDNRIENLMIVDKHTHRRVHQKIGFRKHPRQEVADTPEALLTRKALAHRLHVSVRTLIRMDKRGLPHLQLSPRKTLYDFDEVLTYLKNAFGKEEHGNTH